MKEITHQPDTMLYYRIGKKLRSLGYPIMMCDTGIYSYHAGAYETSFPCFTFSDRIDPHRKVYLISILRELTCKTNVSVGVVNADPDKLGPLQDLTLITIEDMAIGVGHRWSKEIVEMDSAIWGDPYQAFEKIDAMSAELIGIMEQLIEKLGGKKR